MKFLFLLFPLLLSCSHVKEKPRVLVFGKTNRPAHQEIIPGAINHLVAHINNDGMCAIGTQDPDYLSEKSLKYFDAIVFLDVSNGILEEQYKKSVESFVNQGKGLVALHASIAAGNDWEWFKNLIGTSFKDHPPIRPEEVHLLNGKKWSQTDEWYNFTNELNSDHQILATVGSHPVSWNNKQKKIWYTAMGHDELLYADANPPFVDHIMSGIRWAIAP